MKRKIIQLAQKTMVVSLPAKWIRKYGIKKGDEVEIEELGKTIKVNALSDTTEGKTTIKIPKKQFLRRFIDTPYRMGYNEIRIEYEEPSAYYKVQSEVNNLMGFEIIRQGDGYCIARNIAQGIESEFEASLNRLFLVTIGFLEDISQNISESEKLEMIKNTEDITNRLAHFCKRMLNLEKSPNPIRSRSVYRIVCLLEEIGDIGKKMCEYIIRENIKVGKENQKYLKDCIRQFRKIHSLYKKFSHDEAWKAVELEKSNERNGLELIRPSKESYISYSIAGIVENLKHMSEEIFE